MFCTEPIISCQIKRDEAQCPEDEKHENVHMQFGL